MEPSKTFVITNTFSVVLKDVQLTTKILLQDFKNNECITLDIDKWTQLKQNIKVIDEEFYNRFNYQFPNY